MRSSLSTTSQEHKEVVPTIVCSLESSRGSLKIQILCYTPEQFIEVLFWGVRNENFSIFFLIFTGASVAYESSWAMG